MRSLRSSYLFGESGTEIVASMGIPGVSALSCHRQLFISGDLYRQPIFLLFEIP